MSEKGAIPFPVTVQGLVSDPSTASQVVGVEMCGQLVYIPAAGLSGPRVDALVAVLHSVVNYVNCVGSAGLGDIYEALNQLTLAPVLQSALELMYFDPGIGADFVCVLRDPDTDKYFLYESGINTAVFPAARFHAWRHEYETNRGIREADYADDDNEN